MKIRELGPDDWSLWRTTRLASLADSPDAFGRTRDEEREHPESVWRERLSDPTAASFVAEVDGRVVGMAASRVWPDDSSVAWVFAMWVDPKARRRGVGRALLEAAVAWARARGVRQVTLTVTEGNNAAHEMYLRAGFVETGEREPLRKGSPLQTLTMRRRVNG